MRTLSDLPPTARIVLRPICPTLAPADADALIQAIDKLFAQFTREDRVSAHAVEVIAEGAVLAVAFVDGTPLSGCSHDKLAQVLAAHEARTGAKLLDAPPIMIEVDGKPTSVDRAALRTLIATGRVTLDTTHWDLRVDTVGAWRECGRVPARTSWLAPLVDQYGMPQKPRP